MNNRIKECRKAAGMSQKYVSMTLGLAGPSISNWESGKTKPTNENLVRLASLFGVTVDYLLGIDSTKPQEKAPTPDDARAEAKMLLEGMDDEQYQAALQYLKFLNNQK
jgi:transcriptional regulator with XRE-family HTH domain